MLPICAAAASLVPSLLEVAPPQPLPAPMLVSSAQVLPESGEAHVLAICTAAASLVPSLLEVIATQFLGGMLATSVQVLPESEEV